MQKVEVLPAFLHLMVCPKPIGAGESCWVLFFERFFCSLLRFVVDVERKLSGDDAIDIVIAVAKRALLNLDAGKKSAAAALRHRASRHRS